MARGANEKVVVFNKIMETFDGAFSPDGKIIRVPIDMGDGIVEIKVTLTAAKDVLGGGDASIETSEVQTPASTFATSAPTEEEKANISDLMQKLGL